MKTKLLLLLALTTLLVTTGLLAHPHFTKTVEASMKGLDLKVQYTTYPYNAEHLKEVNEGFVFHCGRAKVTLVGEITSGKNKISDGNYLFRAQAKSVDDWTLLLIPEALAGDPRNPDVTKGIALETQTLTGLPEIHHLDLNINSGHAATDGKLILSVAFGPRKIEGILTLPPSQS